MKIDVEKIENMTIEDMKNTVGKDISQEEFEILKKDLLKDTNMRNDILDLVTKYGIENTPKMVDVLIEEMKLYFKLIYEFKINRIQNSELCSCEEYSRQELNNCNNE